MKRTILLLLTFFTISNLICDKAFAVAKNTIKSAEKINKTQSTSAKNFYKSYEKYVVSVETECELTSYGIQVMNGGYVLVPAETVDGTKDIKIKTRTGGRFNAKLIGIDYYHNLALLRVPAFYGRRTEYLTLKEANIPEKNEKLIILPEKMNNNDLKFVKVIETGKRIKIDKEESYFGLIETDGSLKYENSGAPVLNQKGEMVGMAMSFEKKNKDYTGKIYVMPVNTMIKAMNELKLYGRKREPYSGIKKIVPLKRKFMVEKLQLPNEYCYVIEKIKNNSPASNAGFRKGIGLLKTGYTYGLQGDIIVTIDNLVFETADELFYYINSKFTGDIITFGLFRSGMKNIVKLPLKLGEKYE